MKALYFVLVLAVSSNVVLAEDPVYFADPNLKAAVEEELGITDPTPIDMLALTYLNADNRGIIELTGLEYAFNLNTLHLSYNQISNVNALSDLTDLIVLVLSSNQISDVNALSNLTNLVGLYLWDNQISDINALSGLTNLHYLYLNFNQISDIKAVSDLTDLIWLDLSWNQISDINTISGLANLIGLYLSYNQLSDINAVSGLTNLGRMSLNDNHISDINAVSGLTNLIELHLSGNQITNINAVSGLTDLTTLGLGSNQISNIDAVSGLTNLTWLNLGSNQIIDISALSGLTSLTLLGLNDNHISDINAVSGLANLTRLFLHQNQISNISTMADLTNLAQLWLQNNPLNTAAYCIYIPLIEENNPGINLLYDPNPNPLAGDCDGDCYVNFFDFALLADYWMEIDCGDCDGADLSGDNNVNINDLKIIVDNWLSHVKFYESVFDNDPDWIIEGQWQFGQPTGGGGLSYGNPDPNSGYTGINVYGVNLDGDYSTIIGGLYYLTAGPFDCRYFYNIRLKFARWLNTDEPGYVNSMVEVSNDGTSWTNVWTHTDRKPITDDNWQVLEYDISNIANDQETVYIRWCYEVLEYAYPYSGWNIDDIELWGNP